MTRVPALAIALVLASVGATAVAYEKLYRPSSDGVVRLDRVAQAVRGRTTRRPSTSGSSPTARAIRPCASSCTGRSGFPA